MPGKLLTVDAIDVFIKPIGGGPSCPACGAKDANLLATTNEWKYRCGECRARFNEARELLNDEGQD